MANRVADEWEDGSAVNEQDDGWWQCDGLDNTNGWHFGTWMLWMVDGIMVVVVTYTVVVAK